MSAGCIPFWSSRGESIPLSLVASRGHLLSWLVASSPPLGSSVGLPGGPVTPQGAFFLFLFWRPLLTFMITLDSRGQFGMICLQASRLATLLHLESEFPFAMWSDRCLGSRGLGADLFETELTITQFLHLQNRAMVRSEFTGRLANSHNRVNWHSYYHSVCSPSRPWSRYMCLENLQERPQSDILSAAEFGETSQGNSDRPGYQHLQPRNLIIGRATVSFLLAICSIHVPLNKLTEHLGGARCCANPGEKTGSGNGLGGVG